MRKRNSENHRVKESEKFIDIPLCMYSLFLRVLHLMEIRVRAFSRLYQKPLPQHHQVSLRYVRIQKATSREKDLYVIQILSGLYSEKEYQNDFYRDNSRKYVTQYDRSRRVASRAQERAFLRRSYQSEVMAKVMDFSCMRSHRYQ